MWQYQDDETGQCVASRRNDLHPGANKVAVAIAVAKGEGVSGGCGG